MLPAAVTDVTRWVESEVGIEPMYTASGWSRVEERRHVLRHDDRQPMRHILIVVVAVVVDDSPHAAAARSAPWDGRARGSEDRLHLRIGMRRPKRSPRARPGPGGVARGTREGLGCLLVMPGGRTRPATPSRRPRRLPHPPGKSSRPDGVALRKRGGVKVTPFST